MAARTGLMKLFSIRRDKPARPMEELLRACAESGDVTAWNEFVGRTHPVIAVTVLRTARRFGEASAAVLEDLVQETYLKICANECKVLRDFQAEDPDAIFGLLKSIAANVVHDYLRTIHAQKRDSGQPEVSIDQADLAHGVSGEGLSAVDKQILIQQVEDFLNRADLRPVEKQVFWFYYRHGLTTRAIAAIPGLGLTQKGVESVIYRLTARVREWLAEGTRVKS